MSVMFNGREYETNGDRNVAVLSERDIRTVEVIVKETISRVIEVDIQFNDDDETAVGAVSELYESGKICLDRCDDGIESVTVELV